MRNDKGSLKRGPQLRRQTSANYNSSEEQIQALRAELRAISQQVSHRQEETMAMHNKLRAEGIRNQKLKREVNETDEQAQRFIAKQVEVLFEKYKNNKQSPLFNNESGLSPFELLRIGEQKFDQPDSMICMVCYRDLEKGVKIMKLPCNHLLHKECAIQHLLYSNQCPACNTNLK